MGGMQLPDSVYEKAHGVIHDVLWAQKDMEGGIPIFPYHLGAEQLAREVVDAIKGDIVALVVVHSGERVQITAGPTRKHNDTRPSP